MEFYKTYYNRFCSADAEMKEATVAHWRRVHADAIRDKNEDMIVFSARILAVYDMASNGIPFPV